jgi:hypothetical protein
MTTLLDAPVSLFQGARATEVTEVLPLGTVLGRIQDGTYREEVAHVRQQKTRGKAAYRKAKEQLLAFTPCCALRTRDGKVLMADKLLSVTGIVHFDFDHVGDAPALKERLASNPATVFAFISPGDGVKVGIAAEGITSADTYKHPWHVVLRRLKKAYPDMNISEDEHVKFLHALCFVSDDPQVYINPDAIPLPIPTQAPDEEAPLPGIAEQSCADFDPVEITRALTCIPADSYDGWIAVGQGLHSTGHPLAKGVWDWWSGRSTKYTQSVQNDKWKTFTKDGGRTLGDLFTLAHQYGWRPAGWGQEQAEGITSFNKPNYLAEKYPGFDKDSCGEEAPQGITSFSSYKEWPTLAEEALYGLAGEMVRTIAPHTEADPVALLDQLLTYFGVVSGRSASHKVGESRHHANLSTCLVGASSRGRKGSAFDYVQACILPIDHTDFTWSYDNIIGGCGSGEGFIAAVRDPVTKRERVKTAGEAPRYEEVEVDGGVLDKRLLIYESEFSSVLKVCEREHNLLSEVLRKAWDHGHLRNTTKTAPLKATDAHIALIGHITMDELQKTLTTTAAANGFMNRILLVCVKRHGRLPEGGSLSAQDLAALRTKFRHAVKNASTIGVMERDEQAKIAWDAVWDDLTEDRPGMVGCLLARAEAQVLRLSMIYALLDGSAVIKHEHLNAALAFWQYVEASVWYLFGTSLGDPTADTVLAALDQAPKGLTRNHLLTQTLHGNVRADELDRVLRLLQRLELVTVSQQNTGRRGRPAELITRTLNEVNEVNTPGYVSTSNDAVKTGYLSNEVIPPTERGNSQNGSIVPSDEQASWDNSVQGVSGNGHKNTVDIPIPEAGVEEDEEEVLL